MRAVLAEAMSAATKTDAIIVWDIENNRVPTQLIPCCFEIVQWLLQDVKKNCPHSTVLRVYVAGTFDKYPSQLKNALCTHPRVQLLYSIGKVTWHHSASVYSDQTRIHPCAHAHHNIALFR